MYTNKATSVSNHYENSITVTPIKMEMNLSPPMQERTNTNTTTTGNSNTNLETGVNVKSLTINNNFSTVTSATNLMNANSCSTKEKLGKGIKQFMPRKPPPTIENFWPNILNEVQTAQMVDAKHQALPLARIKKIMKLDENAKMIAAEAPLLFAKACELFIQELTMRAWIHTEESKRRTLQRSDIAQAIANYDQFDFLIDIVPREDIKPSGHHRKHENSQTEASTTQNTASTTHTVSTASSSPQCTVSGAATLPGVPVEMISVTTLSNEPANVLPIPQVVATPAITANNTGQTAHVVTSGQSPQQVQIIQQTSHHPTQHMQYFITLPGQSTGQPQVLHQLQLPQQQQSQLAHNIGTPLAATGLNLITQQPQQLILTATPSSTTAGLSGMHTSAHQQQTALFQSINQQHQLQQQQHQQQQQQQVQLVQQVVVTPTGEIANMPIAINANQLNLLRLQMHQQQQAQQHQVQQPTQQIIIPTQLLSAQQLLQLQSQQSIHQPTQTHTTQQIQQQQNHQHQSTNGIYIQHTPAHPAHQSNASHLTNIPATTSASVTTPSSASSSSITGATASSSSTSDNRNVNAIFRTNC